MILMIADSSVLNRLNVLNLRTIRHCSFNLFERFKPLTPATLLLRRHFFRLLHRLLNSTDHIESLLRDFVMFTVDDFFESSDRVLQFDIGAWRAGKGLGHMEWLRQEALDFSRPRHGQPVVFG